MSSGGGARTVGGGTGGRNTTSRTTHGGRRYRLPVPATVSAAVLLIAVIAAVWPEALGGAHPLAVHPSDALLAPSWTHPFGTDESGRDVLARTVAGTRASLIVGVAATLIGGVCGVVLGLLAGLGPRWLDAVISRIVEVGFALPLLLVALVVIAAIGPGPTPAIIAVGFATAPGYARMVAGVIRTARASDVVETAVVMGRSPTRVVIRHVIPQAVWPLVAVGTLGVGQAVVWASALSYLGVGTPPPAPEWGAMLADGRTYLQTAPWMSTFPGIAIVVTAVSATAIGRAVRRIGTPR